MGNFTEQGTRISALLLMTVLAVLHAFPLVC